MVTKLGLVVGVLAYGATALPPVHDSQVNSRHDNDKWAPSSPGRASWYPNEPSHASKGSTTFSSIHTATPTARQGNTGTIPSAVLQSCAASMDGQPPAATPPGWSLTGQVRRYYVAAEEEVWDYAPSGWDNWLGVPFNESARAQRNGYTKYGTEYLKALYRGYTNETFSKRTEQPPWQGTQGPSLRAEVGDMIEIMFVNNMTTHYATMHSMGLAYSKSSEGADYPNNTLSGQGTDLLQSDAVPPVDPGLEPNGCVVYKWMVTDLAGPNNDEPARVHSYHSYVSLYEDANTGLIGPTIIYAAGKMEETMSTYREFPFLFMIYNEPDSFLSGINRNRILGETGNTTDQPDYSNLPAGNQSVWKPQLINYLDAQQFTEAPNYHSINGYIYANTPTFEMCLGDKVIWYLNAYGSASHVFHMHGNGFKYQGESYYAIGINDGMGKTLYMNATGRGEWQVLCHVDHHLSSGMVADYIVYDKDNCPARLRSS